MHWNTTDKVWMLDPGDPGYDNSGDPMDQTKNQYRGPGAFDPNTTPNLAANPQPALSGSNPNAPASTGMVKDESATRGHSNALGEYGASQATPQGVQLYNFNSDVGTAQDNQLAARKKQDEYIAALQAQAAGNGPSAAQEQLKMAMSRNMANQQGSAASARGINPALAQAIAMRRGSEANQASAAEAAYIRAQEQLAAQGMLGTALQQQRGADLNQYGAASGALNQQNANQTNLAVDQAKLNQQATANNAAVQSQITGMTLQAIAAAFPQLAAWVQSMYAAGKQPTDTYDPNSMGNIQAPVEMTDDAGDGGVPGSGDNIPDDPSGGTGADPGGGGEAPYDPSLDPSAPYGGGENGGTGDSGGGGGGGGNPNDPKGQHFADGGEVFTPYGETIYAAGANQQSPTGVKKLNLDEKVTFAKVPTYREKMANIRTEQDNKNKKEFLGVANPIIGAILSMVPGGGLLKTALPNEMGGMMARGGPVPGTPKFDGDDPRNDTVPAALSPGEYVISNDDQKNPMVAAFVQALKQQKAKQEEPSYANVLASQRDISERLKRIESYFCGGEVK